ncbi:MAG: PqqD family protein [Endomicrobiia bacterium]
MNLKSNLAYRKIGNKIFVVDVQKSMLHSVNEIGSEIIELLKKRNSVEDIVKSIVEKYEVNEEQAKQDVENFIMLLKEKNIIE